MSIFREGFEKKSQLDVKKMSAIKSALGSGTKKAISGPKISGGTIDYSGIRQAHEGMTHSQFLSRTGKELEKSGSDKLHGGKGDGHSISEYPKDEVREGRKVEREHTSNPKLVDEIITDHEQEDVEKGIKPPTYYKRLKNVEKTAFEIGFEKQADYVYTTYSATVPLKSEAAKKEYTKEKTRAGLLGGGAIGALTGGMAGSVLGSIHPSPSMKRVLTHTGIGALGAGALGAGLGYLYGKGKAERHIDAGYGSTKERYTKADSIADAIHYHRLNTGEEGQKKAFAAGFEKAAAIPWKAVKSHAAAAGLGGVAAATGMAAVGLRHGEKQRRLGQQQILNYMSAPEEQRAIMVNPLSPEESTARSKALGF